MKIHQKFIEWMRTYGYASVPEWFGYKVYLQPTNYTFVRLISDQAPISIERMNAVSNYYLTESMIEVLSENEHTLIMSIIKFNNANRLGLVIIFPTHTDAVEFTLRCM